LKRNSQLALSLALQNLLLLTFLLTVREEFPVMPNLY
jgi:hypothetical protein